MRDPNENRPGYKQTKVGWIPKEWDCVRFGEIAHFSNGLNFLQSESKYSVRLIGVSDFQSNRIANLTRLERVETDRQLEEHDAIIDRCIEIAVANED